MADEAKQIEISSSGQIMDVVAPPVPIVKPAASVGAVPSDTAEQIVLPPTPPAAVEALDPSKSTEELSVNQPVDEVLPASPSPATSEASAETELKPTEPTSEVATAETPTETPIAGAKAAESTDKDAQSPLGVPLGKKTAHHRQAPALVIVIAVIVALLLAGLSVYAWQKTKPAAKSSSTIKNNAVTIPPIKSTDITQASQDIDKTLSQVNDTKDLNTNDLSNATLGL